jgi:hypothetical protein
MSKYRLLLNYGSIAGLAGFVSFIIYYALGTNPMGNISWLTAWIPILFIYLGTKKHRDEVLGGAMTYGQAFLGGLIITLLWATLNGMLTYLFGAFIDASFVDIYKEDAYEQMEAARAFMSEEILDQAMKSIEEMSLGQMVQGDVFNKLFGGLIVSLIIAAINKRKQDIFEVSEEQEA